MKNELPDSPKPSMAKQFRRHFVTGLMVLAPLWLTGYIVVTVVHRLGGYLSPYLRSAAERMFGEIQWPAVVTISADIVGFIFTIALVAFVGMAVGKVMGQRLVELVNSLLSRIPVVRELYTGVRKFGEILIGDKSNLKRVVAVRFPYDRAWRIGFVTNEKDWQFPENDGPAHTAVFIPGTPNPTAGFLVFYPPEEIMPLSMTVDEAVKLIVSGGTLTPGGIETDKATRS